MKTFKAGDKFRLFKNGSDCTVVGIKGDVVSFVSIKCDATGKVNLKHFKNLYDTNGDKL